MLIHIYHLYFKHIGLSIYDFKIYMLNLQKAKYLCKKSE